MIYDTDNNPLPSYLMNLAASSTSQFTIRVNCRTGLYLRSESVSDLSVEGRKLGDVSWINLETTGIDLTSYAGTRQSFEIKLTAAAISARAIKNFQIHTQ